MPARKPPLSKKNIPFERTALLLQGGGALGAYQGGVFTALHEAGLCPDWIAGVSIGAINGAIIVGNPPEKRIPRLRRFWESITHSEFVSARAVAGGAPFKTDFPRRLFNGYSAMRTLQAGAAGFFYPHLAPLPSFPPGSAEITSFYDTAPLRRTLTDLIDFDRLNSGEIRFTLAAVNVETGNYTLFDTNKTRIEAEHIMASGALPPGFPPVAIGDSYFWDGGLISNTPLQWILDEKKHADTLVFQVDLWHARGQYPQNLPEVFTREKEIQYSSRTRANTSRFRNTQKVRHAFASLYEKLPESLRDTPEARYLHDISDHKRYTIVHLIYRPPSYAGYTKDFEFSRLSMEEHWESGHADAECSLQHEPIYSLPSTPEGVAIFDVARISKTASQEDASCREHSAPDST